MNSKSQDVHIKPQKGDTLLDRFHLIDILWDHAACHIPIQLHKIALCYLTDAQQPGKSIKNYGVNKKHSKDKMKMKVGKDTIDFFD